MMQNNFKYYVFDLDGTLLNSKKNIGLKTLKVLEDIKDKIVLCTGRHWEEVVGYIDLLNLGKKNYIIYEDGFYLSYASGEEICRSEAFESKEVERIIDSIESNRYCVFRECVDYLIEKNIILRLWRMMRNKSSRLYITRSIKKVKRNNMQNFIKINIPNVNANKLKELESKYTLHYLSNGDLDILKAQCNKFSAIKNLCECTNTSLDEVLYFGDSINDVECFENLRYTIAMGNAEKIIKNMAYKVTNTNDNDGVAEFLNHDINFMIDG